MSLPNTIGSKIRLLRLQKGYSQENIADMIGISVSAFGCIERDETDVSYSRLEQIAHALDISVPELTSLGERNIIHVNTHNQSGGVAGAFLYGISVQQELQSLQKRIEMLEQRLKEAAANDDNADE